MEAVYSQIKGIKVISGYSGGTTKYPTYEEVCYSNTGHAEVVKVLYNPTIISLEEILFIFFEIHDPTTLNRQGNDIGSQYRSIIFYNSEEEKRIIEQSIKKAQKKWNNKIVTEVKKFQEFYEAEEYHQKYYEKNSNQGYCRIIISPKITKFKKDILPQLKFTRVK